jgi:hypothetical protein
VSPDLIQPVIGFRSFHCGHSELYSSSVGASLWRPGTNRAVCKGFNARLVGYAGPRKAEPHSAPDPSCACGLYAYHDIDSVGEGWGSLAIGAIAAWGRIEVHHAGFRAEYASVVALLDAPLRPVDQVARVYRAACVPTKESLVTAAYVHGIEIPRELRPPKPERNEPQGNDQLLERSGDKGDAAVCQVARQGASGYGARHGSRPTSQRRAYTALPALTLLDPCVQLAPS